MLISSSPICAQEASDAAKEPATSGEATKPEEARLFPEKEYYTKEEVMALRKILDQKSVKLDQDLGSQKEYVESLKKQVEDHLAKIDGARKEIADFMNARDEKEETKLKKLARFYEAMEPEQASPLLQKVDDDLAIKIFDRMDAKKAGSVLALFPPPRAAKITTQFPKLRLQAEREVGSN
ncbi:MAG: hypothetical protein COV44_07680 [Deltaproteobacteria bacterium CG11_big_fil_rev_8_21_14_0_20_45_16]|nr:MAG: hypothetical protein COV44_07680 [Deltaproteobacteria bacterium CG11_big_fil_rev_8_21_14_0_20_45_16]